MNPSKFHPKEMLAPVAMGFVAGLAIMGLLIGIGLAIGLTPSLVFGYPNH